MKPAKILMLEYDEDDQYLTKEHLKETFPHIQIDFVDTSDAFFSHLNKSWLSNIPLPSLILLNHNSTPLNAAGILRTLKTNDHFKHIPVVVLSGQKREDWIKECYSLGASSFIQKPTLFNDTKEKISSFIRYWFQTVELHENINNG